MSQTSIVLADSDSDLRERVAADLAKLGYLVTLARDGLEALEAIRVVGPAAAVLDWVMPVVQGPAACAQLKADPRTARIPIVLLTARADEEDITLAFERGADDYLTKPFAIEELDEILRRVIATR